MQLPSDGFEPPLCGSPRLVLFFTGSSIFLETLLPCDILWAAGRVKEINTTPLLTSENWRCGDEVRPAGNRCGVESAVAAVNVLCGFGCGSVFLNSPESSSHFCESRTLRSMLVHPCTGAEGGSLPSNLSLEESRFSTWCFWSMLAILTYSRNKKKEMTFYLVGVFWETECVVFRGVLLKRKLQWDLLPSRSPTSYTCIKKQM